MKTVLFIDGPALNEAYRRSHRIFDEFETSGEIVICPWDSTAFAPLAVSNTLSGVIGEDERWRAIVVCDLSRENIADIAYDLKTATRTKAAAESEMADIEGDVATDKIRVANNALAKLTARASSIADYVEPSYASLLEGAGVNLATGSYVEGADSARLLPEPCFNPFDIAANLKLESYPPAIQHPVVRLGHMLAGLPAHVIDEGSIGLASSQYDRIKEKLGIHAGLDGGEDGLGEARDIESEILGIAKSEFPETVRGSYDIEGLALPCPRPNGLIYVSYRDILSNVPSSATADLSGIIGSVRSEFVVRNHYPDKARFVVMDRMREGSDTRLKSDLSFWSSVLILALNPERSFGMRSYMLNRMDIGIDYDEFAEKVRQKYSYAASARTLLEDRLVLLERNLRPDEDSIEQVPPYAEYITVNFDVPRDDELEIPVREYGWLKDTVKPYKGTLRNLSHGLRSTGKRVTRRMPPMDEALYGKHRSRIDREMGLVLDEPRFAIQSATRDFRAVEPLDDDILTSFRANTRQFQSLENDLQEREISLARGYSLSLLNDEMYERAMGIIDSHVKRRLQPRAYLREVFLIAGAVILAALLAFAPYVFGLMGGWGANAAAAIVSAAVTVLILAVGVLALKLSHFQVKRMLRNVNRRLDQLLDELRLKAGELGGRISNYASYKKGYPLLLAQQLDAPPYTSYTKELRGYRQKLDRLVNSYSDDLGALGITPVRIPEHSFYSWLQAESAISSPDFEHIGAEAHFPSRPYNQSLRSGENVPVPYRFIKWFEIREIRVYEPGYESGVV